MMLAVAVVASAQNAGSNSPYSRYGMGLMNDRTGAARSAMAGAGLGMHGGTEINIANPASVAYTDSLTLLFDIGASLQNANLSENGSKVNARNMSLDYVLTAFRVTRNLGLSLGLLPYSTIGYKMTGERAMSSPMGEYMQYEAFEGDGGVHVAALLHSLGYSVANIDSTIVAQAPKMAPHIEQMRRNIADTLSIDLDRVSVKATTTEHLGFEGRKEGISAQAVALIEK